MKVQTYSQARQGLSEVLNRARTEAVLIRRGGGEVFRITHGKKGGLAARRRGRFDEGWYGRCP